MNDSLHTLPIGRAEAIRSGSDVAILAIGAMVLPAERAGDLLAAEGISASVINARFVKPLDEKLILDLATRCGAIVTVEENVKAGGFGSAVLELLASRNVQLPTRVLAVPDRVFEQATQGRLRELAGLTAVNIATAARQLVERKQRTGSDVVLASRLSVG